MKLNVLILPLTLVLLAGCALDGMPPAQNNTKPLEASTETASKKQNTEEKQVASADKSTTTDGKQTFQGPPTAILFPPSELSRFLDQAYRPLQQQKMPVEDNRPLVVRIVDNNDLTEIRARVTGNDPELAQVDHLGRIPLHYAKTAEMVNLLWDLPVVVGETKSGRNNTVPVYEASQDVADNEGLYPLHTVAASGNAAAIQAFSDHWCGWWNGDYMNRVDPEGRTALHLAVMNNKLDSIIELLKCSYVDTAIQDQELRTPLHYAAELPNFPKEGLLLLYRMSDKAHDLTDAKGETPLDILSRTNKDESYALLKAIFYKD